MMPWMIKSQTEVDDVSREPLYWSNDLGWVDKETADTYGDDTDRTIYVLPMDAEWEQIFET